jgi:hypothetical protein
MSTINVDNVEPQSNARVAVGGAKIQYDADRNLSVGDGISESISGLDNSIIGNNAFTVATASSNNTAMGANVLQDCTTGGGNTAMGHSSMANITTGGNNTSVGGGSLANATTASINTAIGTNALNAVVSGSGNVGLGSNAGTSATGSNNIYIGYAAAELQTSGNNNITIGKDSANSTTTVSNEITLGNSSHTVIRAAVTTITSLSDARDKKEIVELSAGLDFVKGLKPVEFVWDERNTVSGKKDIKDFGFIAQDLKKSQEDAKLADTLKLVYEENPEKLEASYGKLIPILVKAIQDLSAKVEALENK